MIKIRITKRDTSAVLVQVKVLFLLMILFFSLHIKMTVYGTEFLAETGIEEEAQHDNQIYDSLKERIENSWEKGMAEVDGQDDIEITGDFGERILRSIARTCCRNLRAMKGGALLIGVVSFVIGSIIALLARKDKKIRKTAISVCMAAIPSILLIFIFGISWYISMFR